MNFETLALETLQALTDHLEDLSDDLDVDLSGTILTVSLPDKRQYLLNLHAPTQQLWLSSPVSGAHHFCNKDGKWVSTRDQQILHKLLSAELSQIMGYTVNL